MNFADYSPPPSPTVDQQSDALRKGLGRAWQWATVGKLDDEPLLDACLHDLRFDGQFEHCRGAWLWEILEAVNGQQRFREPILEAFQALSNEDDANQLCGLALQFASAGDESFRRRLYEIVEQKPVKHSPWLGESELISLDGEKGLLFAARTRGQQLANRDWVFDDLSPLGEATERFGEARVLDLFNSSDDEFVRRYRDAWLSDRSQETAPAHSHQARMQAITVEEIIKGADEAGISPGLFRGWGNYASVADLETVFARLLAAREPSAIANYLRIFSKRSFPRLDPSLFSLCKHPDANVHDRALKAVAQITDPMVRTFALEQLEHHNQGRGIVQLFINNYQPDDERRLLDALHLPNDQNDLHWLLMDVRNVLEANSVADGSQLGVIAYAMTPCAACRSWTASHLIQQQSAPEWLLAECRFDAEIDTRNLGESPTA